MKPKQIAKMADRYACPIPQPCPKCRYDWWVELLEDMKPFPVVIIAGNQDVTKDTVYKWFTRLKCRDAGHDCNECPFVAKGKRRPCRGPGPDTLRRAGLWLGKEW